MRTKIALIFTWLMAFLTLIFAITTRAMLIRFYDEYHECVRCERTK